MEPPKTTVFISHIREEKDVALRLQTLIQAAFSNAFPVFVSSDPTSLGGGEEWYHHILDHLAKAKVVLVLLSPESSDKQWINFEAGVGKGQKSSVVPIAFTAYMKTRMVGQKQPLYRVCNATRNERRASRLVRSTVQALGVNWRAWVLGTQPYTDTAEPDLSTFRRVHRRQGQASVSRWR
jgi:TIR domain